MKKLRKILSLILFLGVVLIFSNTKSFAATEYTENVIPAMTSDTAPSGVASASSIWGGYPAYEAFDHSIEPEDLWLTARGANTGWLAYEFPNAKCITKYALVSRKLDGYGGEMPKDWTFEGWDNQTSTWVILDTQSNITNWSAGEKREYPFSNSTTYSKYRINISASNGLGTWLAIGEFEMMETSGSPSTPPIPQSLLKVVAEVGETLQLSIKDDLSYNTQMTWTSSDSTIATVDNQGRVTGVNPGNAVITVRNADGTYTDTINVLVIESETEVAIDLKVGESRRLTIDDLAGTTPVTWTSDNQIIATISSTGKVTAVAQGTTYVIVKDDQGNEIGKICVRVRN